MTETTETTEEGVVVGVAHVEVIAAEGAAIAHGRVTRKTRNAKDVKKRGNAKDVKKRGETDGPKDEKKKIRVPKTRSNAIES